MGLDSKRAVAEAWIDQGTLWRVHPWVFVGNTARLWNLPKDFHDVSRSFKLTPGCTWCTCGICGTVFSCVEIWHLTQGRSIVELLLLPSPDPRLKKNLLNRIGLALVGTCRGMSRHVGACRGMSGLGSRTPEEFTDFGQGTLSSILAPCWLVPSEAYIYVYYNILSERCHRLNSFLVKDVKEQPAVGSSLTISPDGWFADVHLTVDQTLSIPTAIVRRIHHAPCTPSILHFVGFCRLCRGSIPPQCAVAKSRLIWIRQLVTAFDPSDWIVTMLHYVQSCICGDKRMQIYHREDEMHWVRCLDKETDR